MQLPARYTRTAMILHWVIAPLIILNVILSLLTEQVPEHWIRSLIDTHKSIGITVLGLAILRLLWRLSHTPPPLPESFAAWERKAASYAHGTLYVLMILLPLTGWLHDSAWKAAPEIKMYWFGLFEWPRFGFIMRQEPEFKEFLHGLIGQVHFWSGYVLSALVLIHVAGALKHQWVDHYPMLRRMWS